MSEKRLHVLNNSRSKAFRSCPRLHYFRYELGYEPTEKAAALVTGTSWHGALEAWWTCLMDGRKSEALDVAVAALDAAPDEYEQIRAESMIAGYHARWIDYPMDVLGVEVPFESPLYDPITGDLSGFILGGTIDAICRVGDRVFVVEHKTSSQDFSPGSYYWQRLALDSQVSQYLAAGPALGYEFSGCLYDVIGKAPDIKPRLATPEVDRKYTKDGKLYARQRDADEDPEEFRARLLEAITEDPNRFYGRAEIVRIGDELEQSLLDVWQVGELIAEARELSRWPRNTDSCFSYNRECDFYKVCARGEDLKNEELFTQQQKEKS